MQKLFTSSMDSSYPVQERYPDPAIVVLDKRFEKYCQFNAGVEKLWTGARWAEGPVWFGDGRFLLFSDIPDNRIGRWTEVEQNTTGYSGLQVNRFIHYM